MAKTYPTGAHARVWGVAMTIAAIILGLYLVSLFYVSVEDQAARIGTAPEKVLTQP